MEANSIGEADPVPILPPSSPAILHEDPQPVPPAPEGPEDPGRILDLYA